MKHRFKLVVGVGGKISVVIASAAKQSRAARVTLDCRAALAMTEIQSISEQMRGECLKFVRMCYAAAMKFTAKLLPGARITTPKQLRDELGWKAGTVLEVIPEGDGFILRLPAISHEAPDGKRR